MYQVGDIIEVTTFNHPYLGRIYKVIEKSYGNQYWTEDYDKYGIVRSEGYWPLDEMQYVKRVNPALWALTVMRGYYVRER